MQRGWMDCGDTQRVFERFSRSRSSIGQNGWTKGVSDIFFSLSIDVTKTVSARDRAVRVKRRRDT